MELCDFEATFRQRGLNYEDYEEVCEAVGRYFDFKKKATGKELGYHRKGANAQFYKDGKWDDNTIVSTKEMLLEDWKKYFSDPDHPKFWESLRCLSILFHINKQVPILGAKTKSGVHKGRHFFFLHYSKNINGLHYIEYGINRSIITCQLMIITLKTD